jgi:hypothetical protein
VCVCVGVCVCVCVCVCTWHAALDGSGLICTALCREFVLMASFSVFPPICFLCLFTNIGMCAFPPIVTTPALPCFVRLIRPLPQCTHPPSERRAGWGDQRVCWAGYRGGTPACRRHTRACGRMRSARGCVQRRAAWGASRGCEGEGAVAALAEARKRACTRVGWLTRMDG